MLANVKDPETKRMVSHVTRTVFILCTKEQVLTETKSYEEHGL
jgi:hypothetical protein